MEPATIPVHSIALTLTSIALTCALACTAADGLSHCLAQQQALQARQQVLEARIERLELMVAIRRMPTDALPAAAEHRTKAGDPFASALAQIDDPPILQRADELLALVEQNPTHPRASEALLLSAQALLRAGEWVLADWTFEKVVRGWPHSAEALPALWGRAQSALARGRLDEARSNLEILSAQDRDGALAHRAREALEKIGQEGDVAVEPQ